MANFKGDDERKTHPIPIRVSKTTLGNYQERVKALASQTGRNVTLSEPARRGLEYWYETGGLMPATGGVPILGYIPAGGAQRIQPLNGVFAYPPDSFKRGANDYFLIVSGHSMLAEMVPGKKTHNIEDGDLALFSRDMELYNGNIVHIEWPDETDGEQMCTLKKFYLDEEKGKIVLKPSNPKYETLTFDLSQWSEDRIDGMRVKGVYRKVWKPNDEDAE
jgi:SOS-response transcriptional repressor LexA